MYDITTIKRLNSASNVSTTETETTRHCSFNGNATRGIVLHSAKQRSTGFLSPGRKAEAFLNEWSSTKSIANRDAIVEAYFTPISRQ